VSLNQQPSQIAGLDGSPHRANTKNDSLQGSQNNSRQSRRSGADVGAGQQIYQNRMKVNINNQEMVSNEEQSYLGPQNANDAQNSHMQPQMSGPAGMNQM